MITLDVKYFIYLFVFELLLGIIAIIDYLPAILILLFLLSLYIFYIAFKEPIVAVLLLMFSILAGSIGEFKVGGRTPPILFADLLFPIIIFFLILKILYSNKIEDSFSALSFYWIPFLLWGLLSLLIAFDKIRAIVIWKSYFAGFISFIFSYFALQKGKHVKILILAFIVWGILLACIEFYTLKELGGISRGLIDIFFKKNLVATSWGRSNYLATFFVIIVPLTLGYFLTVNSVWIKSFCAFSILIMMTAVVLTLSRGGILSLTIAIIFFLARAIRPRTFLPILGAILLALIIILLNPLTYVLINQLMNVEQSFSYFTRINFYKDVIHMFLKSPIYGVGLGNLGFHATFVLNSEASAHNLILGMLGETGIIGALLFFTFFGKVISELLKKYIIERNETLRILKWAIISSFLGATIHSMMEPNFEGFQFSIMIWILVALFMKIGLLESSTEVESQKLI